MTPQEKQNAIHAILKKPENWSADDLTIFRQSIDGLDGISSPQARLLVETRLSIESMSAALDLDRSVKQLDERGVVAIRTLENLNNSVKQLDEGGKFLARVGVGVGIVGLILAGLQVYYAKNLPSAAPQRSVDTPRSLPAALPAPAQVQPVNPAPTPQPAPPKRRPTKTAAKRGKKD